MHLHSYRLRNFRRLRDVHVELAKDISIYVGSNNSGKTSATQAIQMFLSASKERFCLFDFSSHVWKILSALGDADVAEDGNAIVPSIILDLWFSVAESDLGIAMPILPSTDWNQSEAGIRVEFGAMNSSELLARYRKAKTDGVSRAGAIQGGAGNYVPWPKSLADYLERELKHEFEFRYFVLDRAKFDADFNQSEGYEPDKISTDPGGAAILRSLLKVDFLNAQRHLADTPHEGVGSGRAENLSRRLSSFYKRNLDQRADDHSALKALFDSEAGLNLHLKEVFEPTLKRIATLGYPGLKNPRIEIKSGLNPANVMSQDAKVHYILGDDDSAPRLPDTYNGLGFKNLIYMVVEILDAHAKWAADEDRPPLHLIFVEEPEAHLHAQLQQVFIRNVLALVVSEGDGSAFVSQLVVTTHSPHILYERGFAPIRYFRRQVIDGDQSTRVLNLSRFQAGDGPKDRDFLQRYLKLTHCDLFFADAAILVEGNVERLLLPIMIDKTAPSLRSTALSILEVGGAFGHRFRELVSFLGVTTLLITDLDSVAVVDQDDADDDDTVEEFDDSREGGPPTRKRGKKCLPSVAGAVTANQTLIHWLPRLLTVSDLLGAAEGTKTETLGADGDAFAFVTYQLPTAVTWNQTNATLCGRTLEESFGLENAAWCQAESQQALGLRIRPSPATPETLAAALHKRVSGQSFDKTKFALGVLARSDADWVVPRYIEAGLTWLKGKVDLEVERETAAVAEAIADAPTIAEEGTEQ